MGMIGGVEGRLKLQVANSSFSVRSGVSVARMMLVLFCGEFRHLGMWVFGVSRLTKSFQSKNKPLGCDCQGSPKHWPPTKVAVFACGELLKERPCRLRTERRKRESNGTVFARRFEALFCNMLLGARGLTIV